MGERLSRRERVRKGACVWISVACARVEQGPHLTYGTDLAWGLGMGQWAGLLEWLFCYTQAPACKTCCVGWSPVLMLTITQPAARDRRGSEGGERERATDEEWASLSGMEWWTRASADVSRWIA